MTHHSTVSKLHFILPDMSSAAITSVSPKHWKRTSAFPALDRRGHYLSIFSRSEFAFRPLCFQPFQLPSFGSFFCIFQIRKATASQLFFGLHISLIIFPGLPFIVVASKVCEPRAEKHRMLSFFWCSIASMTVHKNIQSKYCPENLCVLLKTG